MFKPKYTITNLIASNMRKIGELIGEFNSKTFSKIVLLNMEREARILSAFSSNKIEGNPLALTDVKKILKLSSENIKDTEKEILNYNNALVFLDKQIKKNVTINISNEFICKIHRIVVKELMSDLYIGKYRNEPVFVNDPIKRKTIYLPPDAKDVLRLMSDLIDFVNTNENKIDPLIIAGIFHKQSVIIHPFLDGNGRTTRLITKTLLAKLGINTFPLFSFENFYNNNISKYFQKVGVFGDYYDLVGKVNFTEWLEYFSDGIIDELLRVKKQIPQYKERLEIFHKKILKFIKENGSISAKEYSQITERSRASRIKDFKKLIELGIIQSIGIGKATYYILKK